MTRHRRGSISFCVVLAALVAVLILPAPVRGQWSDRSPVEDSPGGAPGFLVESAGGVGGGVAGFGLGYLGWGPDECGSEEVECILESIGVMMLAGAAGASVGTFLAGRWGDTGPSGWGAVLGSLVGTGAGLALGKVMDDAGADPGDLAVVVGFGAVQGLFAGLGSRLGAAFR